MHPDREFVIGNCRLADRELGAISVPVRDREPSDREFVNGNCRMADRGLGTVSVPVRDRRASPP